MTFEDCRQIVIDYWEKIPNESFLHRTKKAKTWNDLFAVCPEELKELQKRIWAAVTNGESVVLVRKKSRRSK